MSGSSKSSRSYSTPSKQYRVRYFDHFFKNFIRPYGRASEILSDDIFNKRLTNFNCEFLNRPGFSFSEMSESLPMAWDVVKEKLNMIQKKHINKFDNMMDPLDHDFKTIDKKLLPEQPRSSQEVKASLDRLNKFVNLNEGHYFGASALQMSLYYKVCSFSVWNPDLVAAKMNCNSSNAATKKFMQSKDIVSYLDLPVTDITGVPFKGTTIRPVYSLDSSDDDEQATSSSKRSNPF